MSAINGKSLYSTAPPFPARQWNMGRSRPVFGNVSATPLPLIIDWPYSADELGIPFDQANLLGVCLTPLGVTNSDPHGLSASEFTAEYHYGRFLAVPRTLNPAYGYVAKNQRQFTGPLKGFQDWYPAYSGNLYPRPKQRAADGHLTELRVDNYWRPCARGDRAIFGFSASGDNSLGALSVGSIGWVPGSPTLGSWELLGVNVAAGAYAGSFADEALVTRIRGVSVAAAVTVFGGGTQTLTLAYDANPLTPWNMSTGENPPTSLGSFSAGSSASWHQFAVSTPTTQEGVLTRVYLITTVDTVHGTSAQWLGAFSPATDIPMHCSFATATHHAPGGIALP